MINTMTKELDAFAKFVKEADRSDAAKYKDELYQKVKHIAEMIEKAPNKEALQDRVFELFDTFGNSSLHRRARQKPLGYAGDYLMIDWIYTQTTPSSGKGKFFDQVFQSYEAAQAVRNRKQYFINKCIELSHAKDARIDILDIGCGPCRDVLETFQASDNGNNLHFHCVDHEPKAIAYAKKLLAHTEAQKNIRLDCTNAFQLRTSQKYDLIWSAGVFDYLDDRVAALLLKKVWRYLKDDGQIIFGNFSPNNPTKHGMDFLVKWHLIHRSVDDLISLCKAARIPFSEVEVESEPLGVNLFCIIKK